MKRLLFIALLLTAGIVNGQDKLWTKGTSTVGTALLTMPALDTKGKLTIYGSKGLGRVEVDYPDDEKCTIPQPKDQDFECSAQIMEFRELVAAFRQLKMLDDPSVNAILESHHIKYVESSQ
jgi:hypothetical protein